MAKRYRVEPRIARRSRVVETGLDSSRTPREWLQIGRLSEDGPKKEVRFDVTFEHVLAIVGKRGSGKSFTLGSVLEGLCTTQSVTPINHISKERGVVLFDTLNIFQWMNTPVGKSDGQSGQVAEQRALLKAWSLEPVELDVDLWAPAGYETRAGHVARAFSIRPWDMDASDWAALLGVDAMNSIMGQLLTQVLQKVTINGWKTATGETLGPVVEYTLDELLQCLSEDAELIVDYATETRRAVRQRLTAYQSAPIFSSQGTRLTDLVTPGRLSVLLLSGVPDDLRLTVVFLLIRQLLFARAAASELDKARQLGVDAPGDADGDHAAPEEAPPKTWVVIDEAQNIFPSERQTSATATLLRYVREGRNFGLSLAFTTQQPSAIDPRIMAQVDTLLAHTLTVDKDIKNVVANLKSRAPTQIAYRGRDLSLGDAIRELDVGQAFLSSTDAERGLFLEVRPRTSLHGGFEG